MSPRTVLRFAGWTMADDPTAHPGEMWAACLVCPAKSESAYSVESLDDWARRHAARSGHVQFRYQSITYQRAVMHAASP